MTTLKQAAVQAYEDAEQIRKDKEKREAKAKRVKQQQEENDRISRALLWAPDVLRNRLGSQWEWTYSEPDSADMAITATCDGVELRVYKSGNVTVDVYHSGGCGPQSVTDLEKLGALLKRSDEILERRMMEAL